MKTSLLKCICLFGITTMMNAQCWQSVATNSWHTMAIKNDGTVWGWGNNTSAQLGNSSNISNQEPAMVWSSNDWSKIYTSPQHSVAIKSDGTLWTCGNNAYGQIGNGTNNQAWLPTQIGTDNNWNNITLGAVFCLGIKTDGTLWGWGSNTNSGCLGNNSTTAFLSPIQIGTESNWFKIASGSDHTLAIKTDGTLWTWGNNYAGQLGDGTNTNKLTPVQIGTANNWTEIYAGWDTSIAKKSDGTVWGWGMNEYRNLGNGSYINLNIPTQLTNLTEFSSFAVGNRYTIGLKNDGSIWAWGKNGESQLGLGFGSIFETTLTQIGTATNWTKIVAGYDHVMAINNLNQLYTWGKNDQYEMGLTSNLSYNLPTQILCSPLGIIENETSNIKVYPNPAQNFINFNITLPEINIYGTDGKHIGLFTNSNQIDVSSLTIGIYMLKLKTESGKYIHQKFIKK